MLDGLGIETGVNLAALVEASGFMEPRVGHLLPSRYYQAVGVGARGSGLGARIPSQNDRVTAQSA